MNVSVCVFQVEILPSLLFILLSFPNHFLLRNNFRKRKVFFICSKQVLKENNACIACSVLIEIIKAAYLCFDSGTAGNIVIPNNVVVLDSKSCKDKHILLPMMMMKKMVRVVV